MLSSTLRQGTSSYLRLWCHCPFAAEVAPQPSNSRRRFTTTAARCTPENLYTTLGLKQGASKQEIKSQFYALSKQYHPDRNPGSPYAADRFKAVSHAYTILFNDGSRRQHDSDLAGNFKGGAHSYSTGSSHATSGGFDYSAASNRDRRARANYAWNAPGGGGASSWSQRARQQASPGASPFGRGDAVDSPYTRADFDRFERMADRQRRANERRYGYSGSPEARAATASHRQHKENAKQAFWLGLMLVVVLVLTRRSAKADERLDEEPGVLRWWEALPSSRRKALIERYDAPSHLDQDNGHGPPEGAERLTD